jgi:hypothetical protein
MQSGFLKFYPCVSRESIFPSQECWAPTHVALWGGIALISLVHHKSLVPKIEKELKNLSFFVMTAYF